MSTECTPISLAPGQRVDCKRQRDATDTLDDPSHKHTRLHPRDTVNTQVPLSFVVFDLETDGLFSDKSTSDEKGDDRDAARIPRITCAATAIMRMDEKSGKWVHEDERTWHHPDLTTSSYMSTDDIKELVEYLHEHTCAGTVVTGWNSLGFDTRLLYTHMDGDTEAMHKVITVAMAQVDIMYNFVKFNGYPVSLDNVACGMGTTRKTGNGGDMIERWKTGTEDDRKDVIAYCANDVAMTAEVVEAIHSSPGIKWKTKGYKGPDRNGAEITRQPRIACLYHNETPRVFESASDAMQRPFPSVDWMTSPLDMSSTDAWLRAATGLLTESNAHETVTKAIPTTH